MSSSSQATNTTRFLIMSDTHELDLTSSLSRAFRSPLPKADVVLHCGDLTTNGEYQGYEKAIRMLSGIHAQLILVIAGNHDTSLDKHFYLSQGGDVREHHKAVDLWTSQETRARNIVYLEEGTHSFTLRDGTAFTVHASPWTPRHGVSAFQHPLAEDRFNPPGTSSVPWAKCVATEASAIPDGRDKRVDIVMTHGGPKYILDTMADGGSGGCEHLGRAVCRTKPLLHCFGHVHGAWGAQRVVWDDDERGGREGLDDLDDGLERNKYADMMVPPREYVGGANQLRKKGYAFVAGDVGGGIKHGEQTLFVNAAIMDECGEPSHAPWIVDLDLSTRQ